MAHPNIRRVGGRFVTEDAHSTYTRALVAPSATWTQEWVTPSIPNGGSLPPSSKYKVLKWVKGEKKQASLNPPPSEFSDDDSDDDPAGLENNTTPTLVLPSKPASSLGVVNVRGTSAGAALSASASQAPSSNMPTAAPSPSVGTGGGEGSEPPAGEAEAATTEATTAEETFTTEAAADSAMDVEEESAVSPPSHTGEASVLPSGLMAVTGEDGADPAGEGARIGGSLEAPPGEEQTAMAAAAPPEEEVVAAPAVEVEETPAAGAEGESDKMEE